MCDDVAPFNAMWPSNVTRRGLVTMVNAAICPLKVVGGALGLKGSFCPS